MRDGDFPRFCLWDRARSPVTGFCLFHLWSSPLPSYRRISIANNAGRYCVICHQDSRPRRKPLRHDQVTKSPTPHHSGRLPRLAPYHVSSLRWSPSSRPPDQLTPYLIRIQVRKHCGVKTDNSPKLQGSYGGFPKTEPTEQLTLYLPEPERNILFSGPFSLCRTLQ